LKLSESKLLVIDFTATWYVATWIELFGFAFVIEPNHVINGMIGDSQLWVMRSPNGQLFCHLNYDLRKNMKN
jgi:hypothetical protein